MCGGSSSVRDQTLLGVTLRNEIYNVEMNRQRQVAGSSHYFQYSKILRRDRPRMKKLMIWHPKSDRELADAFVIIPLTEPMALSSRG
jgi:hypothetical protein